MSRHLLTHVPRQPLRSSVRRRLAVILEPTVLAAALITSRRYALSRHLLTHVPRQGSALRSFVAVGSAPAYRPPLPFYSATRIECRLFGRSTAEMFLLASGTRRRFLSRHSHHSMRFRNTYAERGLQVPVPGLRSYLSPPRPVHFKAAPSQRYA